MLGLPSTITRSGRFGFAVTLYHATNPEAIYSITINSFLHSKKGMLGPGIYFADCVDAARTKSIGEQKDIPKSSRPVLECRVFLHYSLEVTGPHNNLTKEILASVDCASIHGTGYKTGPEWVVYDPAQIKVIRVISSAPTSASVPVGLHIDGKEKCPYDQCCNEESIDHYKEKAHPIRDTYYPIKPNFTQPDCIPLCYFDEYCSDSSHDHAEKYQHVRAQLKSGGGGNTRFCPSDEYCLDFTNGHREAYQHPRYEVKRKEKENADAQKTTSWVMKTFVWRDTNINDARNKLNFEKLRAEFSKKVNLFRVGDSETALNIIDGVVDKSTVYVACNRGGDGVGFLEQCRSEGVSNPCVIFCGNTEGLVVPAGVTVGTAADTLSKFIREKVLGSGFGTSSVASFGSSSVAGLGSVASKPSVAGLGSVASQPSVAGLGSVAIKSSVTGLVTVAVKPSVAGLGSMISKQSISSFGGESVSTAGKKTFIWRDSNITDASNKELFESLKKQFGKRVSVHRVGDNESALDIIDDIVDKSSVYVACNRGNDGVGFLNQCRMHGVKNPCVVYCGSVERLVLPVGVTAGTTKDTLSRFITDNVL